LELDGVASPSVGERGWQETLHACEPRLELARHGIARHARHSFGDLAQRQSAAWRAGDFDASIAQLEVAHADFQEVRGDLERLVADRACCEVHRRSCGHRLSAGESALAIGDDGRVAGRDGDGVRRDAELLGTDLRQRGLDSLPHGHRAGIDGNASGAADAHDAGFEWAAPRAFYAVADAEAEIAALGARMPLAGSEAVVVDRFE